MFVRRSLSVLLLAALAGCSMLPAGGPGPMAQAVPDNPLTRTATVQSAQLFGPRALSAGGYVWVPDSAIPASGQTRVLVSLRQQRAWVYRADRMIGMTTISSGVPGHPTVPGRWPILQKARFHKSNKYSNAPMPFMQRLDQYGIALHAGVVPGHPASHGCVRLPAAVARRLFNMTRVGDPVDIEA